MTARKAPRRPKVRATAPPPRARFPECADDKVICAKSIIQAVIAAHDAEQDMGNYDLHWPLSLAVEILEQAVEQSSKEGVRP